jgi:outer membrane immunogenic protein
MKRGIGVSFSALCGKQDTPDGYIGFWRNKKGDWAMRKLLLGVVFALVATAAQASDLPVKGYSQVAPVPTWTGFYLGGQLGYGYSNDSLDVGNTTATQFNCCGSFIPGGFHYPASGTSTSGSLNVGGDGFFGGIVGGYDYQLTSLGGFPVVIGAVADIDWTDMGGSANQSFGSLPQFNVPIGPPGGINIGLPTRIAVNSEWGMNWLATIRARLGVQVGSPNLLLYVTGGGAVADLSGTNTVSLHTPGLITPGIIPASNGSAVDSWSDTKWGWAIGGGAEYKLLPPHWSLGVEYLYVDLGSRDSTVNTTAVMPVAPAFGLCPGVCPNVTTNATTTLHQNFAMNLVRFSVNYRW